MPLRQCKPRWRVAPNREDQMTYIKKGYGFDVGQNFARAVEDTPIEIDTVQGCWIYGYIAGNPQSSLAFMRAPRIRVRVRNDCLSKLHTAA